MKLNKKKVLVTGAGGFIGSHLVEHLLELGAEVKALVKYNARNDWGNLEHLPKETLNAIEIVSGDIADPYFVHQAVQGCSVVFHLAALIGIPYSYVAPQHYVNVNIQGTLNVLEACRTHAVEKLVHTSTSETYGTALYTPIDENHPLQGQSPYSATKIAADKLAESYFNAFDLPVSIIRPFNTFGPRQSARAVIPTMISQVLGYPDSQQSLQLGNLAPKRDFNYVKDTVSGFTAIAAADDTNGKVINIGTGVAYSMAETLAMILELCQSDEMPLSVKQERVRPEKSEVDLLLADATLAKALTGWSPQFSLKDGLQETIQYVQNHLHQYKTDRYAI
ncbi:MAG: SDR family NAD(P)-dependent oxidoreductase [Cyanobacteria bacterium P01_H01_bin.74]